MATPATGQPPIGVAQPITQPPTTTYASIVKNQAQTHPNPNTIPLDSNPTLPMVPDKPINYIHGDPTVQWTSKEWEIFIMKQNLQFSVVGKFSYGRPYVKDLRKLIPTQCDLKGSCYVGFVDYRYVLIKCSTMEDYVSLLSRSTFDIKFQNQIFSMRTLKWTPWFDPNQETSIALAWISFPNLPPHLFAKEALFSLAKAVGKPLKVDMATQNQTRPSCARVKVEVDLLGDFPSRVQISCLNETTGEVKAKWIKIQYDYKPKYCKECCLQGHNEDDCRVIHPELVQENDNTQVEAADDDVVHVKILKSGKVVGPLTSKVDESVKSKNQVKKFVHPNNNPNVWNAVKDNRVFTKPNGNGNEGDTVVTTNAFSLLDNIDDHRIEVDKRNLIVQEKGHNVSQKNAEEKGLKHSQHGTREWAEVAFKEHPKNHVVGESVVSGRHAVLVDKSATVAESLLDKSPQETVDANSSLNRNGDKFGVVDDRTLVKPGVAANPFLSGKVLDSLGLNAVTGETEAQPSAPPSLGNKDTPVALNAVKSINDEILKLEAKRALLMSGKGLDVESLKPRELPDIVNKDQRLLDTLKLKEAVKPLETLMTPAEGSEPKDGLLVTGVAAAEVCVDSMNVGNSFNANKHVLEDSIKEDNKLRVDPLPQDSTVIHQLPCHVAFNAGRDLLQVNVSPLSVGSIQAGGMTIPTDVTPIRADGDASINAGSKASYATPQQPVRSTFSVDVPWYVSGKQAHDLDSNQGLVDPKVYLISTDSDHVGDDADGGAGAFNDDTNMVGVVNKEANTIPSSEERMDLESESVSMPISPGNVLIPTAELERICKSSSPKFGKSYLNINSPPFVPKSLMQVVPHSKRLPSNDELIKQMDWNDTKGFLARQGILNRELALQGHYLLEDDDIFEEEELDDESTAHNFAMVARQGDLSPRDFVKPSKKRRERQLLQPTRVQPVRSTKSKSKK